MTWILLLLLGCAKECEYVARCDGEVLQTCSLGPDQLFGSGESETDCASTDNPVCVELETDVAFCSFDTESTCTPDETWCDGATAFTCNSHGFATADDCANGFGYGPTCVVDPEEVATCGVDPVTTCDFETFERSCDGDRLRLCSDGIVKLLTCSEDRACGVQEGSAGCLER